MIKKVKTTVPNTYIISDLTGKEIAETFYENELQKAIIEKLIKRKGDKLYVKWKFYDKYFSEPKSLRKVRVESDLSNYSTKQIFKIRRGMTRHLLLKRLFQPV